MSHMQSIKLSIIVPIYNVEPYLRKCVESLLTQDLDPAEYEIILVDDGSPDGCSAICDEYAQTLHPSGGSRKGANIKVIHQPNAGLSAARNTGIMAAKGKYVQFVDSDDYLQPNVLRELVEQMERENLDVLRFDYQNVRINQVGDYEVFQPYKHPHQVDMRTDVVDGETYLNERMGYACYAVQFIIRRSLLSGQYSVFSNQCSEVSGQCSVLSSQSSEVSAQYSEVSNQKSLITNNKSSIFFTPGIYLEDTEWTPRMLLAAKRVNSSGEIVYNYLSRDGSIMRNTDIRKKIKLINSLFVVNDTLQDLMQQVHDTTWLLGDRSDNVFCILKNVARYDFSHRHRWLKKLRDSHVYPLVSYKSTRNTRIKYKLINASPMLFCYIEHWRNK